MKKRSVPPVHGSIKEALGYARDVSDRKFWSDWNKQTSKVCKPCWELKYCPYGKLVDLSPTLPPRREDAIEDFEYLRSVVASGTMGRKYELDDAEKAELEEYLSELEADPVSFASAFANRLRVEELIQIAADNGEENPIAAIDGGFPPLEHYRTAFPIETAIERRKRLQEEFTPEVQAAISKRIGEIKDWLRSGVRDETRPVEPWRRKIFEERIAAFNPDEYPPTQPNRIYEKVCNVFGHVCPVFFTCNAVTETTEERRRGRYIPFATKMRIVRRDNYTCQHCGQHLLDTEVEFDHIIPLAKGGSTEEANLRLTCFDCNRSKSDVVEL